MAAPPLVIDEVQLPVEIARGAQGGPMFSTIVAAGRNATEKRIAQWVVGRRRWDISHARRDEAQADTLAAFFYARRGKLFGFRFQDPEDYQATEEVLYPTGAPYVQLERTYTSGPVSSRRVIYKPVQSVGITLLREGVPYTLFAVDWTSGMVFLSPDSTKTITGITKASAAVFSCTAHGFLTGEEIWIQDVAGMTQMNDRVVTISGVTTDTFTVSVNSTGFSTYTSGGLAKKFVQSSEALLWTGEFDIPARFDTDECVLTQTDVTVREWEGITIIELIGVPAVVEQDPPDPPVEEIALLLAYKFEDGAIEDNTGTGGATYDLTQADICEG